MSALVPGSPAGAGAPAGPQTILLVDDDAALRNLLTRVLQEAGYHVIAAEDGRAALRQVLAARVDLVVTDVYMPRADGVELVMNLREKAPHIPVIAMSASFAGMGHAMLRVLRLLGAGHTLEKPFSLQELLVAVEGLIGRP